MRGSQPRACGCFEIFRVQDLQDSTIAALNDVHFDIPPALQRIDVVISPKGATGGLHYTPPSEDLVRPGRISYPIAGGTRYRPLAAIATAFHEGVPGHHLQTGQVRIQTEDLSRYQRVFYLNVHGEGWALYAEQLMMELGHLESPEARLSMLQGQVGRTMRVVLDIGLHLGLRIPATEDFHPGEAWHHDLAVEWLSREVSPGFAAAEVYRYLGAPGQAITYKVGHREWVNARTRAERRVRKFDLKHFHTAALALGPLGIDSFNQVDAAVSTSGRIRAGERRLSVAAVIATPEVSPSRPRRPLARKLDRSADLLRCLG